MVPAGLTLGGFDYSAKAAVARFDTTFANQA